MPSTRPKTLRRLGGYLALARISNSPTVVTNVLAGAALAGASVTGGSVALVAFAMVLLYTAGMFLNDLCDYATDLRERPERPLPSGVVTRRSAAGITIVLFVAGGVSLLPLGAVPFASGLALIGVVALYDVWHKANPLAPVIMAAARALVYVTAYLAFVPGLDLRLLAAAGALALYIVALTSVARGESGRRIVRRLPAAMLFAPAAGFALVAPSWAMAALLALYGAWVAYSLSFAYRDKGRDVGGAVGRLIAGVALFDALVLAAVGSWGGVALALVAFLVTLSLQRHIEGT